MSSGSGSGSGNGSMEGVKQTPEQLLALITNADRNAQLRLCKTMLTASEQASKCFLDGHAIEIDNLKRHIDLLSRALLDVVNNVPIDNGLLEVAKHTIANSQLAMGSDV